MKRSTSIPLLLAAITSFAAPAIAAPAINESFDRPGLREQVVQLTRSAGDTVTLQLEFENVTDHDLQSPNMGEAKLDDPIQRKEYLVLTVERRPLSTSSVTVPAHSRVVLWAKFPAPPPMISSISVAAPDFAPIDDVPLR